MMPMRTFLRDTRGALISIAAFKVFAGKLWDRTEKQGETVGHINSGPGQ
jgi:hypothetical protein